MTIVIVPLILPILLAKGVVSAVPPYGGLMKPSHFIEFLGIIRDGKWASLFCLGPGNSLEKILYPKNETGNADLYLQVKHNVGTLLYTNMLSR